MSMVTYILLCALHSGVHARFHPRVLGESASRAFMVVMVDFVFVQLCCYFLNVSGPSQSFDVVAYGGYKFVAYVPSPPVIRALRLSNYLQSHPRHPRRVPRARVKTQLHGFRLLCLRQRLLPGEQILTLPNFN